jgi:hypothetical protein
MQPYQRTREKREQTARITGAVATLAVHALAGVVLLTSGLTYLDPPPPERSSLVIEFEDEELQALKPMQTEVGRQPQAEEINLEREVELVQKAEAPTVNDRPNVTPKAQPDAHGDVETPAPPAEPELDKRTLFPGMAKKDDNATTPHSAAEATEGFKAGQPDGNTKTGKTEGSANAHVKGRNVVGTMPRPSYETQTEGIVVVQVKVDQYGNVTEAVPGAEGTTVADKNLWNAARVAAMKTTFNMDANAPAVQTGTITYIFKLK